MDGFFRLQGFQKPLQKRHFARALLEQNGLRKARRDFLNTLLKKWPPLSPLPFTGRGWFLP